MPITLNGSAGVTTNSGAVYDSIQRGTAVASTSGTSIDFTGIPSWVKRITVMFNGVSGSASSAFMVQIGSGSVTTSGYVSQGGFLGGSNNTGVTTSTAGFLTANTSGAGGVKYGNAVITNLSGNTWVFSSNLSDQGGQGFIFGNGGIALGGTLDRIRITTVNGTDTFDAGSINIIYE